jgi:hypothetical protein
VYQEQVDIGAQSNVANCSTDTNVDTIMSLGPISSIPCSLGAGDWHGVIIVGHRQDPPWGLVLDAAESDNGGQHLEGEAVMNETIPVETVGIIHTPFKELENMPVQSLGDQSAEGTVVVDERFAEGLRDLDGFSHI